MANFLKPSGAPANSYDVRGNRLAYVYVPIGSARAVALWGGVPDGNPLWVNFNDHDSAACPAKCVEKNSSGGNRNFTLTGSRAGSTMLEARLGGRQGPVWDSVQVVVDRPIAWGAKVSHAFKLKVIEICTRLKIDPDHLMSCMAFETGKTFSPSVKNAAGSGAVGLIQFMPTTAKGLKTTTSALAAMSAVQQLDYVGRYMTTQARAAGVASLSTLEDVYMAILYPAAIGKPTSYVLFRRGTIAYKQNAGLDTPTGPKKPGDGNITKYEAAQRVRAMLSLGRSSTWLG